jgi:glycosyltransferase involved in cell wall biosynthesis
MRILLLTQILPYPPDAGPRVKTWHVLRHLARRGHHLTLASFIRHDERQHLPAVEAICPVVPVPLRRSRWRDAGYLLRSQLTGKPFLIERDHLPAMQTAVNRILTENRIDLIHADQLGMAQFALRGAALPAVKSHPPATLFDAHNAVWLIVERMAAANPLLRPALALEARRIKRYETSLLSRFDHTMTVTDIDRRAYLDAAGDALADRLSVIPIAADTQTLQPALRLPGSHNILTLGTLHYPPNADGIRWFVQHVYPGVRVAQPHASLTIIGKHPPPDFLEFARRDPSIQVTGYVPDLDPYMAQAALMVVPVRAGGGMRVRILEAFARAMPVVTTTVGLEGIAARPGEDVLVADTPADFQQATLNLLADPALQARLAANGRRLAEEKYDWQIVLRQMDAVYERLAAVK